MTLDFYVRKNTTNNAKKQLFDSTNLRIMFLKATLYAFILITSVLQ